MKTLMMMIATVAGFNQAQARDNMERGYPVVQCILDEGIYDFGINVEIRSVPMVGIPEEPIRHEEYLATVTAFGFDGQPHLLAETIVNEFRKDRFDGPRVYQGENFKLSINMRVLNQNGMYPAVLKATDLNGNTMNRKMACEFYYQLTN